MNNTNGGQKSKSKEKVTGDNNPVKLLRDYYGLKQKQLADTMGVSISIIKKLESGVVPISERNKNLIKEAFGLQDNWYDKLDFNDDDNFKGPERTVCEYITELIGNKKIAKEILLCVKNILGVEDLSGTERKVYIQYVNRIMYDVNLIATDAKKHLCKNGTVEFEHHARQITHDIKNIPGYEIKSKPLFIAKENIINIELEENEKDLSNLFNNEDTY